MLNQLSLLSLLFTAIPLSLSQTSDVDCLPYYEWMSNSQGQTSCEVASSLLSICNGGTFNVLALSSGEHYQGPTMVGNANSCICNTVTFSLMTACGLCQGRSTLRWSEWSTNCPTVTLNQFPEPLPAGLRVPAWAYNDVRITDTFDQFKARDSANATESTAAPVPSTLLTPSQPATTAISTTEAEPPASSSSSPSAVSDTADSDSEAEAELRHANLVGGAVVGSLLGAAVIIGVGIFLISRRRPGRSPSATVLEKGPPSS